MSESFAQRFLVNGGIMALPTVFSAMLVAPNARNLYQYQMGEAPEMTAADAEYATQLMYAGFGLFLAAAAITYFWDKHRNS